MSRIYDFLKDVYPFFVLTSNGDVPNGRPFGAICEIGNKLYIATSPKKQVYKEIYKNPNLQIVALKAGTRDWIRLNGVGKLENNESIKEKVLSLCPILRKHYFGALDPNFAVFEISVTYCELNTSLNGKEILK